MDLNDGICDYLWPPGIELFHESRPACSSIISVIIKGRYYQNLIYW
jgi:hypothetical protein